MNIQNLTYYTPGTGEIVATVVGESQPSLAHLDFIEGIYPAAVYYISAGAPKERRKMLLSIEGLTITGIPNHAAATINGESYVVDDGSLEITRLGLFPVRVTLAHMNYIKEELVL